MTHSNIINTASDKLKRLDAREEARCRSILYAAKEQRDLLSYRFPASGLRVFDEPVSIETAVDIARLFAELAQLNLACFEGEVARAGAGPFELAEVDEIWDAMRYETRNAILIDDDDYLRVGYFLRRYHGPVALIAVATAGVVDDFFSSWCSEDGSGFNPDAENSLLLNLL